MASFSGFKTWFIKRMMREPKEKNIPLCDFDRIKYELRPCDVILVEGQSRVSEIVQAITQSPWSHAALYIGRIHDIDDPLSRERLLQFYDGGLNDQLVIEGILGKGTIVSSLEYYKNYHIRICRPSGISRRDAQSVINFAISRLGMEYGIRHNLDLARLMLPWRFLPKRWRSSLFTNPTSVPTKEICSSMIAEAFGSVHFPILPIVKNGEGDKVKLFRRNPRLYTPRDFDYSPYFDIIKYPFVAIKDKNIYRNLPWEEEVVLDDKLSVEQEEKGGGSINNNDVDTMPQVIRSET